MKRVGMLSKILLGALAVEALLYLLIASLLARFLDVSTPALIGGALTLALLVRLKMTADMFRASERNRMKRGPEQCVSTSGALRLFLAEYLCMLRTFVWLHPFEWLHTRRDAPVSAAGPVILCIHGYVCNGGYWVAMRGFLRAQGFARTYTINMDPTFGSIEDFAQAVAARVEEIRTRTGADKVVLLGHSMGGLVSRCYVQRHGGADKVSKIITLGTPHLGTYSAKKGPGEDARQMVPGNPWITGLNAEAPVDVPITSIYSCHDNIIFPQDYSVLPGAKNVALYGIGHLELAFSRSVQDLVLKELRDLSA
jgi:triacylglycerol esterase/lipase EstA (alpha/beta hydrolase family)